MTSVQSMGSRGSILLGPGHSRMELLSVPTGPWNRPSSLCSTRLAFLCHSGVRLSPPGTPPRPSLPITHPPTPIPHSQTPIPPLLQRKQPRNPPASDWKENQYKVKNAEQFRDKPKRTRKTPPVESGPSNLHLHSPQPLYPPPSPQPPSVPPQSPLPNQSSIPGSISLSPPPGLLPPSHPQPSPSPTPSSPALWQHRDPTPAIPSDDEDDSHDSAQASPEEDEGSDEDDEDDVEEEEEEDSSDPQDDTYDPAADDTFYSTSYAHAHANISSIPEPRSFKDSQRYPESSQWKKACLDELDVHTNNGTWKVTKLPPGKKVVGSRWQFKV